MPKKGNRNFLSVQLKTTKDHTETDIKGHKVVIIDEQKYK